jgi:hypothetical protein
MYMPHAQLKEARRAKKRAAREARRAAKLAEEEPTDHEMAIDREEPQEPEPHVANKRAAKEARRAAKLANTEPADSDMGIDCEEPEELEDVEEPEYAEEPEDSEPVYHGMVTDIEEAEEHESHAAELSSSPTMLPEGSSALQAHISGDSMFDFHDLADILAPSDTTSMIVSYLEAMTDSDAGEEYYHPGSTTSSRETGDEGEDEDEYEGPRDQTADIKAYTSQFPRIFGETNRAQWGETGLLPDYEIVSQDGSICLHYQEEDEPHNPERCVLCRTFERPCDTVGKKPAQKVLHATRATIRAFQISEKARLITERLKLCEMRDRITEQLGLVPDRALQKELLLDYLEISRLLSGAIHDTMRASAGRPEDLGRESE